MGTLSNNIRKALLADNDHLEPLVPLLHHPWQSRPECGADLQAKEKWVHVELSTLELKWSVIALV